jgi:hydroxymethylglutaryl-CoA lyase
MDDNSARLPSVILTEEGMRDGLQIERIGITVEEKLRLLTALTDAGLKRIVVGSFVSPKWTPQMADIDLLLEQLAPRQGVTYLALALNERGRERARRWTPPLTAPSLVETHLHMCDVFIKRNTNRTMAQQEKTWRQVVDRARAAGINAAGIGLSAAWGSNWRGGFSREARVRELRRQFDAWSEAGIPVTSITLNDPMGWNTPTAVAGDLSAYKELFPSVRHFHLHLHNTRGMAMASAYAALTALGAADTLELDCAIGGIGGCPYCGNGQAAGMIPTEDLVQMLEAAGIRTGVDLPTLVEAAALASTIIRRPTSGRVSMAGPLPSGKDRYDPQLPAIETLAEAQHFRLGAAAYRGRNRPC